MSVPSKVISKGLNPVEQEEDYVHNIYNEIAPHFSQTRYKPWPIVEQFLLGRPKFSIGIDVGCGNGKYLGVNKDVYVIGTDRSSGLINCAKEIPNNDYNLGIADGLSLPHPESTFDFAISIAVIHHFSTPERRVEAIKHILSKINVGGELLVYCWALEQENSRRGYKEGGEQDILIPWVLPQQKKKKDGPKRRNRKNLHNTENEVNKTKGSEEVVPVEKDVEDIEESPKPVTKYRYYHLYSRGELEQNCLATGDCTVVKQGYEMDNWWVIVKRI